MASSGSKPRRSGSRPRRRVTHEPKTDSSDSDGLSWDELGDAVNAARRASLVEDASQASSIAKTLGGQKGRAPPRGMGRGGPSRGLPTIFASGKSTRDFAIAGGSLDESESSLDPLSEMPIEEGGPYAARGRRLSTREEEGEEDESEGSMDESFSNSLGPVKLNHSMRPNEGPTSGRPKKSEPVESWDDLQDEIAAALKQSMLHENAADIASQVLDDGSFDDGSFEEEEEEEQKRKDGAWNCPACTFLNEDPLHLVCAICGTAKVAGKVPQAAEGFKPSSLNRTLNRKHRSDTEKVSQSFNGSMNSIHSHGKSLKSSFRSVDGFGKSGSKHVDYSQDTDFRNSFQSEGSGNRGDAKFRHSTGSSGSGSKAAGGCGGGRSGRRRGVRRGQHSRSEVSNQSEVSVQDLDSFGSLDMKDYNAKSFKPRGGGRRGDNQRLYKSVSGAESVNSHRSRRRGDRGDDHSRSSRRRGGKKGGTDFRRSTSQMDNYDGNGYNSYEDSYESGDGENARVGSRISADSGSDCSDLSEDDNETLYRDDRTERTMRTIKTLKVPEGEVTIIYTDVQGSTSLWEADPLAMKKGTDIHDRIIRKCYADNSGYEITTEGDAFNLAFQHPADAINFALKAQLSLYRAKWPQGILNHPDGCDNEKKKFRGFRVRFGMHHGPTTSTVHETTGRTIYQGEAVNIAKAIEKMSHGGQILTTVETWRTVSGMAEQFLGSPQVMDCGEHLLYDPKKEAAGAKKKRIFSKRIVQLVPNSLSYDFFAARGGQEVKEGETPPPVCGRVFPPLLSHGQLSTSFLNAPYIGNRVAMVFVYTDKMEAVGDRERKKNYKILSKYVRSHLMRLSPPGYECQEDKGSWMLAFDRIENGIRFGLDLKQDVVENADLFGKVDKEKCFRVGIHWGPFLSMGPHTVSGHADYFGPIVNRAARVAAQCEAGQVCVGVPMGDGEEPPDPGPSVDVDVLGVKQLKGISIEMAIFACRKRVGDKKKETEE